MKALTCHGGGGRAGVCPSLRPMAPSTLDLPLLGGWETETQSKERSPVTFSRRGGRVAEGSGLGLRILILAPVGESQPAQRLSVL